MSRASVKTIQCACSLFVRIRRTNEWCLHSDVLMSVMIQEIVTSMLQEMEMHRNTLTEHVPD